MDIAGGARLPVSHGRAMRQVDGSMRQACTGATREVRRMRPNRQRVKSQLLNTLNGCDRLLTAVAFFMRRVCDGNLDKLTFQESTFDRSTCPARSHQRTVTFSRFLKNLAKLSKSGRNLYSYNSAKSVMIIRPVTNKLSNSTSEMLDGATKESGTV
jgi:hypothetical protein